MHKFQVFLDNAMVLDIEADYYRERISGNLHFFKHEPKKWWQLNRDVKVGHFEFTYNHHISVKRVD